MGFDPKAMAEQLLADCGPNAGEGLDQAELERALSEAYAQGRATAYCLPDQEDSTIHELFFRVLMQSLKDFIYFKDKESRFIALTSAHAAHFGKKPEDVIGKSDSDFFPEEFSSQKLADEQRIIETGEGWSDRIEHHFLNTSGEEKWALTSKHPWRDSSGQIAGTFGHSRDITAKIKAEKALEEQYRLLETLIDVLPCRIFIRDRKHCFRLLNAEYRRGLGIGSNAEVIGKRMTDLVKDPRAQALIEEDETIMRTGAKIMHRIEYDTSPVDQGKWLSVAKVPLRNIKGVIEGIVGVSFDISAQRETERRARAVGNELAQQNQRIESELSLARRLQVALATFRFPEVMPLAGGIEVHASYLYEPSEHLAGDFFQLATIDDHRFGAFVCDVMGHGVRSALVTAVIRGLIEEHRDEMRTPARFFSRLNNVLYRLAQDPDFPRFVTATFALFDTQNRTIELANAGHPPSLCHTIEAQRADGAHLHRLATHRDPALGLIENFSYRTTHCDLIVGATYLFYTDGLTEQRNPDGVEYGREGLEETLTHFPPQSPEEMIAHLRHALERHSQADVFDDDVCALALTVGKATTKEASPA